MQDLFDEILTAGEVAIEKLVNDSRQETVELEFKCKESVSTGKLSNDDKRVLGRTLSGFSNSAGGVLIWGVDARPNADGVDCASSLAPICEIEKFKSNVISLVGDFLLPKNDDVHVELVKSTDPGRQDSGYLIVKIGRSERRPHQSKAPGDGRYYKRVGDSFYQMEHYDIEDMFNRNVSASLDITRGFRGGSSPQTEVSGVFLIGLSNHSSVTARYPYLEVLDTSGCMVWKYGIDGNGNFGLPRKIRRPNSYWFFSGGADDVIHPGQEVLVFGVEVRAKRGSHRLLDYSGQARPQPIRIHFNLGCENSRLKAGELVIEPDDVDSQMRNLAGLSPSPPIT